MSSSSSSDRDDAGRETALIRTLGKKVSNWTPVSKTGILRDSEGAFAIEIDTERGTVLATAKEYPYNSLASFSKRIPKIAAERKASIAVFFDEPTVGNGYVYNPRYVLVNGVENRQERNWASQSEPSDPDTDAPVWIDIELTHGVVFGDFISGRENLQSPRDRIGEL